MDDHAGRGEPEEKSATDIQGKPENDRFDAGQKR